MVKTCPNGMKFDSLKRLCLILQNIVMIFSKHSCFAWVMVIWKVGTKFAKMISIVQNVSLKEQIITNWKT
jgi:hypothetical protein